jgi:putative ABC transport system ATP-binding protein
MSVPVVEAAALTKVFRRGRESVRALDGVQITIHEGEFVAVTGPSGSGKSTLLQLLGAMDRPTSGTLSIVGQPLQSLSDAGLTRLRREQIGFVFQHFGLLPVLTVEENIALPLTFTHRRDRGRVDELLVQVGLEHRRRHRASELSGGEMQRVAIARALVNRPRLLLADEPTGNLDTATGESVLRLFESLHREAGVSVILVTHNEALANRAQRRLVLRDGRLVSDGAPFDDERGRAGDAAPGDDLDSVETRAGKNDT